MRIVLPWPPSANTSKNKTGGGRFHSTKELTAYHHRVVWLARSARLEFIEPPYRVTIWFRERRFRGGDLANFEKAPIDALVKAGVLKDDRFIDDYRFVRCPAIPEGLLGIEVITKRGAPCATPEWMEQT